jgi:negative regulator of flagellin synthesis FlgM
MKIDDRVINYSINQNLPKSIPDETSSVESKRSKESAQPESKTALEQDSVVHFSKASKEAQRIREVIAAQPDFREDKVAELKARIAAGEYSIHNDAVADKLVNDTIDELF